MNNIFSKLLYELEKDHDTVLVTIISEMGSTPRGTGSQMLVGEKGRIAGTIGGGAVEYRSEQMAIELIGRKESLLHEFRLHKNDTEDIGMVCGGDVTVFFQFISHEDPYWGGLAGHILELISEKRKGWLIQKLDGTHSSLADEGGKAVFGPEIDDASKLCEDGAVLTDKYFSIPLPIGERAVIFGGGHITLALVPILKSVGFRVTVMDNRQEYANTERFPDVESVVCGDYLKISDYINLNKEDYVVVMTNGHSYDFEVQEQVLRRELAYVGVIGSRHKTASVNAKLREQGISEESIKSVHTPIGTEIMAVTPEEIAVSIAGEMILVRAKKREAAGEFKRSCPMH